MNLRKSQKASPAPYHILFGQFNWLILYRWTLQNFFCIQKYFTWILDWDRNGSTTGIVSSLLTVYDLGCNIVYLKHLSVILCSCLQNKSWENRMFIRFKTQWLSRSEESFLQLTWNLKAKQVLGKKKYCLMYGCYVLPYIWFT